MLASLYYEPLWIFYRGPATLTKINELHGKRMAAGVAGSGTRALVDQMLAANGLLLSDGVPRDNTEIAAIGGNDAVDALKAGTGRRGTVRRRRADPRDPAGAARPG